MEARYNRFTEPPGLGFRASVTLGRGAGALLFFFAEFFVDFAVQPLCFAGVIFFELCFKPFELFSLQYNTKRFLALPAFAKILGSALFRDNFHLRLFRATHSISCCAKQIKALKSFSIQSAFTRPLSPCIHSLQGIIQTGQTLLPVSQAAFPLRIAR